MKSLFPDQNPPMIANECSADEACIWLLSVMDEADTSRRFIASLLNGFLDRGWLSEKQMDALHSVVAKVAKNHAEGNLECQGAAPSKSMIVTHGKVIPAFGREEGDDCEVLE